MFNPPVTVRPMAAKAIRHEGDFSAQEFGEPECSALWMEADRPDLHLHFLQGVVGAVPGVPSDPICCLRVLAVAVKHTVQVGVGAAVVPVTTWKWGERWTTNLELICLMSNIWAVLWRRLTFAQGCTVIHTFVVVPVEGAEVGVVVVAQGVSSISTVVGNEELVAVDLIGYVEEAVLSIALLPLPVLQEDI